MKTSWKSFILIAFTLTLGGFSACTEKKEDNAEVIYLRKKVHETEEELASYEDKMKSADHGLQTKLTQDRELNKSRLERLKHALQKAEDNQKKLE
jgi:hypothetical protein